MDGAFQNIYERCVWGDNQHGEYKGSSGGGSSVEYNLTTYIPFLRKFILGRDVKSVVDLGCGDFRCGEATYGDLDITYHGYDVYGPLIESNRKAFPEPKYKFTTLDFYEHRNEIESADLCILKDVLQHWPVEYIVTFLREIIASKKFKFILITNCCSGAVENQDIEIGGSRPLSYRQQPLKQFKPIPMYIYNTKEVCMIKC